MRILITGVCGFVGSTLAQGLKEGWPSWDIVGLDNLVRAGSEINRSGLRRLGVKFFHGDIRNPGDLEVLPPCDRIFASVNMCRDYSNPQLSPKKTDGNADRYLWRYRAT